MKKLVVNYVDEMTFLLVMMHGLRWDEGTQWVNVEL